MSGLDGCLGIKHWAEEGLGSNGSEDLDKNGPQSPQKKTLPNLILLNPSTRKWKMSRGFTQKEVPKSKRLGSGLPRLTDLNA